MQEWAFSDVIPLERAAMALDMDMEFVRAAQAAEAQRRAAEEGQGSGSGTTTMNQPVSKEAGIFAERYCEVEIMSWQGRVRTGALYWSGDVAAS